MFHTSVAMKGFNQEAADESLNLIKVGIATGERDMFWAAGSKLTTAVAFIKGQGFPVQMKELYAHFKSEIGLSASAVGDDLLRGLDISEEFTEGARLMYLAYAQNEDLLRDLQTEDHMETAASYLCGAVHEGVRSVRERRKSSSAEMED